MRSQLRYLLIVLSSALLLSACKEFIEPSISNKTVTLQAPGEGLQTNNYKVNFWWDEVEDALSYRLQVVTPNFINTGALVLDTVVKSPRFAINLDPGKYQWRVLAQNGSSKTDFSLPRSFTIEQSSIKPQSVQLISPANNFLTRQTSVIMQWGSLYGATGYRLQIDTNSFANETALIYNQVIPGQQYTFSFPKDYVYQWRIRAENDTAQSRWSVVNTITHDHTPPSQVVVTAPNDAQVVGLPVALKWNAVSMATTYKLYVYKSDQTTLYSANFPILLNTTSFSISAGTLGDKIYWKVVAIDAAGNEGQASVIRSFTLQ